MIALSFAEFCADLLGEPVSKPWLVFYAAVEGEPLDEEGVEIFRQCTGRDKYEPRAYQEATAVTGRRSEKTSSAIKFVLWKALTASFAACVRRGELLRVPVVCQDQRIAKDVLRVAKALLGNSPHLRGEIAEEFVSELRLRNGLALTVYPCSVRAPRGLAVPLAVCDELAFWQIETGSNPDKEVLRALRPAMIQFGNARRLLKISSPWMRAGVVYDEYSRRAERPELLVWQASTATMTPRISAAELERERQTDPSYYQREYLAEFTDDVEAFLPCGDIDASVVSNRRELPPHDGLRGRYFATLDASSLTGRDRFTLAVGHRDVIGPATQDGSGLVVDCLRGWSRAPVPQVLDEAAATLRGYGLTNCTADQYSHTFLRELMQQRGIEVLKFDFSARSKPEVFVALKAGLSQGRFQLLDHPESLRELRMLESKRLSGGSYKIGAPRSGHDDFATVLALLAHRAKSGSGMVHVSFGGRGHRDSHWINIAGGGRRLGGL